MRRAFRVSGKVQGVLFRASAAEEASRRELRGWVRNRADGAVEGVVEGPDGEVEAFLAWCRSGPPAARVDSVVTSDAGLDEPLGPFRVQR